MIDLLAFALACCGFTALALAMNRHHRQVWGRNIAKHARFLLRVAGTAALALSLTACVVYSGWSIGPVLWFGLLTAAGIVIVLFLAFIATEAKKEKECVSRPHSRSVSSGASRSSCTGITTTMRSWRGSWISRR